MRTLFLIVTVVLVVGVTGVTYMSRSAQSTQSSSPSQHPDERENGFEIAGRVINAGGEAVAGARVFVESDDVGGRVTTDISDNDGNFRVKIRELGNYTVCGSKEEDGYPLTVSAFHNQVSLDQIPKLRITERKNVENVILQLGQSAAKIEGTINDALSGRSIRAASIMLRRADNPDLLYRTSTDAVSPGKFTIVVPPDPFTITIESPGYRAWTYGDESTPVRTPRSMKLNRGEVRRLQVGLRKE